MSLVGFSSRSPRRGHRLHALARAAVSLAATAAATLGLVVTSATPAAAFSPALIINSTGGTTTANGLKIHYGSGQFQVYRAGGGQVYGNTANPGATTSASIFNGIFLTVGSTVIGPKVTGVGTNIAANLQWDTITTAGTPAAGGSGTVTSTLSKLVGGLTYTVNLTVDYTYPNDYFTNTYAVTIPTGNTATVKLYHAVDAFLGGSDAGPGFYQSSPTTMVGTFSAPGAVGPALEAFRYRSGPAWTSYVESTYYCQFQGGCGYTGFVNSAGNYPNTVDPSPTTDSGYGINYNLGTTAGTTTMQDDWVFRELKAQLTKTFSAASMVAGATANVALTVTNAPDGVARTGLAFNDTLPAGLTVAAAGVVSNTCGGTATDGSGGTLGAADTVIKIAGAAIPAGTTSSCVVTVAVTAPSVGTYVNSQSNITVVSTTNLASSVTAQTLSVVPPSADLSVTATSPTIAPGGTGTTALTISNAGASIAPAPTVTFTPPTGTTVVVSSLPVGCTGTAAGPITCVLADLGVAASNILNIALTIPASTVPATSFTDGSAAVSSTMTDPVAGNNTTAMSVTAGPFSADLSATTTTPTVTPGTSGIVTVGVTNGGPSDAEDAQVEYNPPTGATVDLLALPAGCTGTVATGPITCTVGALAAGDSASFAIPVLVSAAAAGPSSLVGGTVVASATTADPVSANDTQSSTITTSARSSDLTSSATTPTIAPGASGSATMTVSNAGPSDAALAIGTYTPPVGATVNVALLPAGCAGPTAGPISCSLGTLASGAATSVVIPLVVAAGATPLVSLFGGATGATSASGDPTPSNNTDSAAVNVGPGSADVSTVVSTPTITPGDTATATITVSNAGPSDADGPLTVGYSPPVGATIVALPLGCTGPLDGPLSCTIAGPLAAGTSGTIDILLAAPADAIPGVSLTGGTASATSPTADPTPGNDTATSEALIGPRSADLVISATTPAITPGTTGIVTVTAQNNGPSDVVSATVTYNPPTGSTVVVTSLPAGCTGAAAGPITCTITGPFIVGATPSLDIEVAVASSASASSTLVGGSVTIASSAVDPATANNTAPSTITTTAPQSDLAVGITTPTVSPGGAGNAVITVTNNGPSDNPGPVTVSYSPPAGTTITSLPAGCTGPLTGPITCTIAGPIANAAAATVTVPISLPANATPGDTLAGGSATATSAAGDPTPVNNTAPSSLLVGPPSSDVSVTVSTPTITPGTTGTAVITMSNIGPSDAPSATVTYSPPTGVSIVSLPASCTGAIPSGPLTCTIAGPIAAGDVATIPVVLSMPANATPGTLTGGTAGVSTPNTDPNSTNDSAPSSATVGAASADLSIVTVVPSITPGTTVTATVTVSNVGPSDAPSATVTFTPPLGVAIVSLPSNCTGVIPTGPLSCTVTGPIQPGVPLSFPVLLSVPASATPLATLTGSASVTSTVSDPTTTNNAGPVTVPIGAGSADVATTVANPTIAPGDTGNAVITVSNAGPSNAAGPITVSYSAPTGVAITALPSGCTGTLPAGPLSCIVSGPLTPSAPVIITVPLALSVSAVPGTLLADGSADASSSTADPVPTNNASVPSVLVGPASADVSTLVSTPSITPGETGNAVITVSNAGPSNAAGPITVSYSPPVGVDISVLPAGCTGALPAGPLSCTLAGPLAPGTSATIGVLLLVPASTLAGSLSGGSAGASSPTADPVALNNTVPSIVTALAPSADVSTLVSTPSITPGDYGFCGDHGVERGSVECCGSDHGVVFASGWCRYLGAADRLYRYVAGWPVVVHVGWAVGSRNQRDDRCVVVGAGFDAGWFVVGWFGRCEFAHG